jgi:Amt family ammonium transporter
MVLGPRIGKFKDGKVNPIPGHNMTSAVTGALVLWLGWFGFNPGSTMAADPGAISRIIITTNSAGIAGVLTSTLVAWLLLGKPDLSMTINGLACRSRRRHRIRVHSSALRVHSSSAQLQALLLCSP